MKKIYQYLPLIIMLAIMFTPMLLQAQPGGPPDPGGGDDPGCWPPPCIPIDGGAIWLVVAGLLYGGKKALKRS